MKPAAHLLTADEHAAVCQAVAEAETRTCVEIVPVIAAASGRYDRAEDLAGLWLAVVSLVSVWLIWPQQPVEVGSWGHWPAWIELVALAISVVLGFALGALAASRLGWLRRMFIPPRHLQSEVQARARQAFFDARVHHAPGPGGLLLYVSLYERQAVILADAEVLKHIGQDGLDQLCEQLTGRLRTGRVADALCQTIETAGQQLTAVLPRREAPGQCLPNTVVVLERL